MNPGKFYQEEKKKYEESSAQLSRRSNILSIIRATVFVVLLVAIIYLVNIRELQWAIGLTFLLVGIMALLVRIHNRIKYKLRISTNGLDLIEREQKRLKLDFTGSETGKEYEDEHHPFSSDLDLFGNKSIFQLVNQTTSFFGNNKLAEWLKYGATKQEIEKRQEAAKELAQNQQWCLLYRSVGLADRLEDEQVKGFREWMDEPAKILQNTILKWMRFVLPVLFILITIGAFVFDYTLYFTLPGLIISGIILSRQTPYAKQTVDQTYKTLNTLKVLSKQLQLLEGSQFGSAYLSEIKEQIVAPHNASEAIEHLHKLLDRLLAHNNMLHIFFNLAFLLDIWALRALEKWRYQNAQQAIHWFDALATTESLISLSGMYFNFPGWTTPQFSETVYSMKAEGMAHPMLNEKAVANNFSFSGKGQTFLITGPNMAGKSTFLRTVAANYVLAQTGAPVRASHFVFDPGAHVFTAMRVKDNLNESVSSFYAELDRIKQLIGRINSGEKCLYFLDELLKGTNSADRHKGAESLIKQLHKLEATGFVSTHDLELGALASKENYVHNYSFESTIENDFITFDYTIREGISSSFNACALMRKMGIEVK